MENVTEKLYAQLEGQGLKGRVVPIRHLFDLKNDILNQHARGNLAEEFYQERMQFYDFNLPVDLQGAQSLVVIAIPRPQTSVGFSLNGKPLTLTLPPTYARYDEINREIEAILSNLLAPDGFRVAPTQLPLKLLAAHSGLVEYGRNNISYISGMGSFFQLSAYYSDLPCPEDTWQEPHMMKRCNTCQACLKMCPTGAIAPDRFLLHAERCIVFHNERPSSYSFPAWIDREAHNCLMGCMICQRYCPEDKPFLGWFEEGQQFSSRETYLLLEGATLDQLPVETVRKLEALELVESLDNLSRNLSVFLNDRHAPYDQKASR